MMPRRDDRGSAVVEFVGVSVMALVPLMYLIVVVFDVQRAYFAATAAAREAGRAIETADSAVQGAARAVVAVDMAFRDYGVPADTVRTYLAATPEDCRRGGAGTAGAGLAGAVSGSTVCVTATVTLPGVPSVLDAGRNTVTGAYVVHLSPFEQR